MPSSDNHFSFLHFFFFGMVLVTASCTVLWISVHSYSHTLSGLIPWIYLLLPLHNHKWCDLGRTWMAFFLIFKSEFWNKLMIWATVSSWSCFCVLYRASQSSAAKNIISLIPLLILWWCPCVQSSLVLLEEDFFMTSVFSWQNSVSLCPASFCTPRQNLSVTPDISWFPTFACQSPVMQRDLFWVLVLKGLINLHRTIQVQLLWH